ncbi:MAG: hypothetical protein V3V16_11775 [Melioribacteraceae bacterium]
METFRVDLNPLQRQSKHQPYFFFVLGIFHISNGIYKIIKYPEYTFLDWIWIPLGILFVFLALSYKKYFSKYFFEINQNVIQVKQSIIKSTEIKWSDLVGIIIKPISIEFHLVDGKKKNILLGNVGYKNVIDIKSKLLEFAKQKNIKVI